SRRKASAYLKRRPKAAYALSHKGRGKKWLVHDDLHAVAHLDLGACFQAVEDAEAFGRAVDAAHAVGERFHGVAGLHGDDLEAQGTRGLDFLQRQAAEGVDGLARVALALGGLLPRGEDEAVDVGAEAQHINLEMPLVAGGDGGGGGE